MSQIKILNVDDHDGSREATSELLRNLGYAMFEAATGSDALRLVREVRPQLVLLDVKLPDISGHEVCRRLKDDPSTASIPILEISASFTTRRDRVAGLESGADAYLAKPVEPDELVATIRALLRMREAEEARRETEASYDFLFERNSLPTWIIDIESLAFLAVNEAAVRHYGYSRDEFLSMTIKDIRPPEDVPLVQEYIARIPEAAPNAVQWRHRKKDGTTIDVEVIWHELFFRGRHALLVLANDITERKHAEAGREELLAREKAAREEAQAASRAKDAFLAIVSHELRAPLNAILGWAAILRSQNADEATRAHAAETIERSARIQSKLIEDLLDSARVARGQLRLEVQPVDLTAVIDAAVDVMHPAAEAKHIEVRRTFDVEREVITGDPDRLQQIVSNLLSNAIKFTPSGGQVEIRLERVDPHVRISVTDTGTGIIPDYLPHVFERFNQAHGSTTRRRSGLGLGLSLVRNLVELHGGTVNADSPGEGCGSTFTVNLPLRAVRPQASDADPTVSTRMAGLQATSILTGVWVLLVDDEADARELVATLLQQYGAKVTPVASAEEALALLTSDELDKRPDVLVSDISMPEVDGYELIGRVRELTPEGGGRIPAVALTAYGRAIDRIRALSAGFNMHLPKPVEPAELAAVVASLTGRAGRQASAQQNV
ncbi:MAG TPA: response regulator [Blastocatellia bacterium]|nr:response regulator [Blastocatellia bacterium]